jgi:predicted ester cyclase
MSTEQNKAVIRQVFEMIQSGRVGELEHITAANWVNHDPSLPPMQGMEGAKQLGSLFHNAFPDARIVLDNLAAEGDRVGAHFTFSGTHTGSFLDLPPTGKRVAVQGAGLFRVVDGKLAENWVNFDALGLMQQLGVVPAPGQAI